MAVELKCRVDVVIGNVWLFDFAVCCLLFMSYQNEVRLLSKSNEDGNVSLARCEQDVDTLALGQDFPSCIQQYPRYPNLGLYFVLQLHHIHTTCMQSFQIPNKRDSLEICGSI